MDIAQRTKWKIEYIDADIHSVVVRYWTDEIAKWYPEEAARKAQMLLDSNPVWVVDMGMAKAAEHAIAEAERIWPMGRILNVQFPHEMDEAAMLALIHSSAPLDTLRKDEEVIAAKKYNLSPLEKLSGKEVKLVVQPVAPSEEQQDPSNLSVPRPRTVETRIPQTDL